MEARKEEDRNEDELVQQVKPLLEQAEKILNETLGSVKGADPDKRLSNKATRHVQDHKASPEEQRLAEALKVVRENSICHKLFSIYSANGRSWGHHRMGKEQAGRVPKSQKGSRATSRCVGPFVYFRDLALS